MDIRLKLKPIVYSNNIGAPYRYKDVLHQRMTANCHYTYARYCNGYITDNAQYVVGLNFTKVRRKVKVNQVRQGRRARKGDREVVRESHWIGYKYLIPVELLKLGGLKVVQHKRHFDIVPE